MIDKWVSAAGMKSKECRPTPAVGEVMANLGPYSCGVIVSKTPRVTPNFTFIDLFAGIGGFHLGMVANGGLCVYANEWDKYAGKTYRAWTGFADLDSRDLRLVDPSDIPNHDILCAGFPCQPFSLAGVSKKNSLGRKHGFDDPEQGNLFFAIRDVVKVKRPKILLLENVKNLKSHDSGKTWDVIKNTIEVELGYYLYDKIIDSSPWVPQRRERIFLVAFNKRYFTKAQAAAFEFPQPPRCRPTMRKILDQNPEESLMITDKLWDYLQEYAEKHRIRGNGFGFGLVGPEDVSRTMSARYYKDGSEILIQQSGWRNPRRLSFQEAARLMGFDKVFSREAGLGSEFPQINSLSQSYRQFGNSVCPHVTKAIGGQLVAVLDQAKQHKRRRSR
jgi:DNA (cytosine-5)-methyltransferase 1